MTYYDRSGQPMPETGVEGAHVLGTSAGGETILGPAGNSSLSGEGGGDTLVGSSGDNRHFITDPRDVVQETANGGIDTQIGWTAIRLAPNVENLVVNGDFNYAMGNALANLIVVDNSTHWLWGAGGDDVLVGATTAKTTFVVRAGEGSDVIYNWNGNSQLQLHGQSFTTGAAIRAAMTQSGADVVLSLAGGETLTFRATTVGAFQDRQFLLPLDQSKLGGLTFGDDFGSLSIWNPSTQTGTWRADFGGNLKDEWAYTLTSNGERQVYVQPGWYGQGERDLGVNPFSIDGGVLSITAAPLAQSDREAAWGREYTSGMLNTLGVFEQKYGYFEMRAELPTAVGTWPAFWMIPTPYRAQTEADIMEALAATPNVDYRRAFGGADNLYDNGLKIDATGFHTYGMLWTPTTVSFYFDGIAVLQAPTPASWTEPMAMIVNMAVGGWGGEPNESQFPATMKIDYVHAYGLAAGGTVIETGTPDPPPATLRPSGGATSGQVNAPVAFESDGSSVAAARILVADARPAAPTAKTFVIWQDSGAVFGAAAQNGSYDTATGLGAGANPFTGAGSWLSDGKVALAYMQGAEAWVMVFDPAQHSFTRHQLGAASGDVRIIATRNGGFVASWDAPDGTVHGRGYDAFVYDGEGWYGPDRTLTGDLLGVTAGGQLIAESSGGQQLYDLVYPPRGISAIVSIGPQNGVTHAEGNAGTTSYTFTLTREFDLSERVTVGWQVGGQGANPANAADFAGGVLPSGVATFEINQATATVTVQVATDATIENAEQFLVTLVNPVGARLGQATATGFIDNDDTGGPPPPPPGNATLTFTGPSLVINEGSAGATPFTFTVGRSGDTSGASSVDWSVVPSGANPAFGADFVGGALPTGVLTFAPGETSRTIAINVAGDTTMEANETFHLNLSNPSGAALGPAVSTSGKIGNDDAGVPFLTFTGPSLTINEGNAGSTPFTFTVGRMGDTSGPSSVTWNVVPAGSDPAYASDFVGGALPSGVLTFAPGETSKTITINVAGDTAVEGAETFHLDLSNPSGATLGPAISTTGTITNDDIQGGGGQVIDSSGPGSTLTGGAGNDTLNSSRGSDVLTGGGGADVFAFAHENWSPARITDFISGIDKVDLRAVFDAIGFTGADPFAAGYMRLIDDGAGGTKVLLDRDAAGPNPEWPNYILQIEHVAPASIALTDWLFQ